MATSSIFANFVISDEETARKFVDALEECEKNSEWVSQEYVPSLLTDHDAIRALVARGMNG